MGGELRHRDLYRPRVWGTVRGLMFCALGIILLATDTSFGWGLGLVLVGAALAAPLELLPDARREREALEALEPAPTDVFPERAVEIGGSQASSNRIICILGAVATTCAADVVVEGERVPALLLVGAGAILLAGFFAQAALTCARHLRDGSLVCTGSPYDGAPGVQSVVVAGPDSVEVYRASFLLSTERELLALRYDEIDDVELEFTKILLLTSEGTFTVHKVLPGRGAAVVSAVRARIFGGREQPASALANSLSAAPSVDDSGVTPRYILLRFGLLAASIWIAVTSKVPEFALWGLGGLTGGVAAVFLQNHSRGKELSDRISDFGGAVGFGAFGLIYGVSGVMRLLGISEQDISYAVRDLVYAVLALSVAAAAASRVSRPA